MLPLSEMLILEELAPFDPVLIYIFGSQATGATHPASDLDLALLASGPCDPVRLHASANRLASRLHLEVDLVDLARATTVMRKEVVRTGRLIHGAGTPPQARFEMEALSDYARLNEERAPVLAGL